MFFLQNRGEEAGKKLCVISKRLIFATLKKHTRYEKDNFCSACRTYHYSL